MFKEITKDNWMLYAQQNYDNPTLEKDKEFNQNKRQYFESNKNQVNNTIYIGGNLSIVNNNYHLNQNSSYKKQRRPSTDESTISTNKKIESPSRLYNSSSNNFKKSASGSNIFNDVKNVTALKNKGS